ncbi:hypothetical protein J4466_04255 [Candidatus Pacearchaeota archaeon]|nr:hypothetical protein [Candidatus Pacearchaeota archaeon]
MIQRQEYAEVPVYMGQASASLDKGRFLMPEKYRKVYEERNGKGQHFYLGILAHTDNDNGFDYFVIHDRLSFSSQYTKLEHNPSLVGVTLDEVDRFLIPANIRESLGLENDIKLIGPGTGTLEIWNPETFASYLEEQSKKNDEHKEFFASLY